MEQLLYLKSIGFIMLLSYWDSIAFMKLRVGTLLGLGLGLIFTCIR